MQSDSWRNDIEKIQAFVASVCALFAGLALAAVIHLVSVFPRTEAVWAEEGRALSAAEQALAQLSNLGKSFGLFIVPASILAVIGFGMWAVLAWKVCRRESVNEAAEDIGT